MAKRVFDIVISVIALCLLAPVIVIGAITIWVSMRRPILFSQVRPGLHGKPFKLYKFRTMLNKTDKDGVMLPDAARITKVGILLRALSIDELPQLWNVLIGDMSIVGPRPLLLEYLPLYSTEQARRHEMRPGITGWAQVNGRNGLTWEEKFAHDVWYIDHWSMGLDIRILWMTIVKVFLAQGISQEGHVTAEKFRGVGQ